MITWQYRPSPDIDRTLAEHLRNFPREPRLLEFALRSIAALLLRAWMRSYHRLRVTGLEHLPRAGSFVLVCNHTSHLDTLALLCAMPIRNIHRVFPAAAADYFFSSVPRSAVSAILINALPFDRKLHGADSLAVCRELLQNDGNALVLFPEGTRTTTGRMGRFRSGIGRLVAGTDLPVVPCYLEGGLAAWPKGRMLPRPRRLRLRIGTAQHYGQLAATRQSAAAICQDLERHVAALGEQSS